MKLVIDIEPPEDAPKNWRLTILRKLEEFMDSLDVADYRILIDELSPYVIRWAEPQRQST